MKESADYHRDFFAGSHQLFLTFAHKIFILLKLTDSDDQLLTIEMMVSIALTAFDYGLSGDCDIAFMLSMPSQLYLGTDVVSA